MAITTGAEARKLPKLAGVYTLRSIKDPLALRRALQPGSHRMPVRGWCVPA